MKKFAHQAEKEFEHTAMKVFFSSGSLVSCDGELRHKHLST